MNNFKTYLLNKKQYYKSQTGRNICYRIYSKLWILTLNYFLIITIAYNYMNSIYNVYIYSKQIHSKARKTNLKKEQKKCVDFNHIARIIYYKNIFSSSVHNVHTMKNKNIQWKKNIFKQIFVQNKKAGVVKETEEIDTTQRSTSDSIQSEREHVDGKYVSDSLNIEREVKDKKSILSLYKSAKSSIKSFMGKHIILNIYLEKLLNLFNHKNFNVTKIVMVLFAYFSFLLFPLRFEHLIILKVTYLFYKGYTRRFYKNVVLNSILEKIKIVRKQMNLFNPLCALNEVERSSFIEEINKSCNQNFDVSIFKEINDEYDLADLILNNFKQFCEFKKIVKQDWNFNLLNNSPHDSTIMFNSVYYN